MTRIDAEMNALLGSRICHDLISPLGAIANGVELLRMSGGASTPEVDLIEDSVAAANARVRLFRIAFGAAEAGQSIGWGELGPIVAQLGANRRVAASWHPEADTDRAEAKLGVLLLLCAETLMPYGGSARLILGEPMTLIIEAERMRDDPELLALLRGDPDAKPTASAVHFSFARLAAEDRGRSLRITQHRGGLTITA